nr:LysR family transcriptional regulator [Pectobacterium brasiliense]
MVKRTVSANKSIDMYAVYVFVTMAEAGSMTAAATRLGLTPLPFRKRSGLLEEDFGVKLVNRLVAPLS